jgi:hypothetical protein
LNLIFPSVSSQEKIGLKFWRANSKRRRHLFDGEFSTGFPQDVQKGHSGTVILSLRHRKTTGYETGSGNMRFPRPSPGNGGNGGNMLEAGGFSLTCPTV